jgi:predicted Zn finger-like uncharacterized protein
MPVTTACPTCRTTYTLADTARGKKVRCKKCQGVIAVPGGADNGPGPEQAVRSGPARGRQPAAFDGGAPRPPRGEDDEVPRHSALPWIIGGSVGGAALIAVVIVIIVASGGKDEPKAIAQLPNAQIDVNLPKDFPNLPKGFPKDFPKDVAKLPRDFPPPNVPKANPDLIQAPATKVLVGAKATEVKDIVFAHQAGRVGYLMWDTGGDFKKFVDVYDINTGNQVCRVEVFNDGDYLEMSPDGTRLVKMEGRTIHLWSLPDGKLLQAKWNPYEGEEKKPFNQRRELAWCTLLDRDHLLTAARNGAFEVWNTAQRRLVYANPPHKQALFVAVEGFSRRPKNIAISPDRRTLAVTNKDGYNLYEAGTGKLLRPTATLALEGSVGNEWALNFSPDGNQLAAKFSLHQQGGRTLDRVVVYDVATGAPVKKFEVRQDFQTNGPITWWGPNHLVLFDGNVFSGRLMDLSDGKYRRVLQFAGTGRFAASSHNGMLFYPASVGPTSRALLLGVHLPANDLTRPMPAGLNPPAWHCSHEGIRLKR